MANEQYLKSLADRPESERKRIATMGGHASVKARRKRKHGQELVRMMLQIDHHIITAPFVGALSRLGIPFSVFAKEKPSLAGEGNSKNLFK